MGLATVRVSRSFSPTLFFISSLCFLQVSLTFLSLFSIELMSVSSIESATLFLGGNLGFFQHFRAVLLNKTMFKVLENLINQYI